jgi:hypothetical protein
MKNPSLIKLAERLLSQTGSSEAQFLVGQLPEPWPSSVPLIEDTQLVGSVIFSSEVRVILKTQLLPKQVLATYRQVLISRGARVLFSSEDSGTEDRELSIPDFEIGSFFLHDGRLNIETFIPTGENVTNVRLCWVAMPKRSDLPRASGSFNLVSTPQSQSASSSSNWRHPSQLPMLIPPLDAPYLEMPRCVGADARGQLAIFRGTVAADAFDVLEYFAQQLANAGWQRIAQAIGQADTCYTWRVPMPGESDDAWGVLWVLEWPGRDHQKVIMVRAEP